jgi:hypothetical protein
MAEFCLKSWNELNNTNLTEKDVTLSKEDEFCEGCGELHKVIEKISE